MRGRGWEWEGGSRGHLKAEAEMVLTAKGTLASMYTRDSAGGTSSPESRDNITEPWWEIEDYEFRIPLPENISENLAHGPGPRHLGPESMGPISETGY